MIAILILELNNGYFISCELCQAAQFSLRETGIATDARIF
jgi:hypothetical protein